MSLNPHQALLSGVAEELADVRAGIESLSGLVSDLATHCPADLRGQALVRAQAFDEIIQRMEGLGGLIAALGVGISAETALKALTLTDLSRRLARNSTAPTDAPVAGDLMLFD